MNSELIFKEVKDAFCSLWTYKVHGKDLEIITPISTTNFKFISVFVSLRGERIIVSDGGWLFGGDYDTTLNLDDDAFAKIYNHYESLYEINSTTAPNGRSVLYKSSTDIQLVPNLVYDLSHFLSAIISTSQIQFEEIKEKEERENFRKVADNYIAAIADKKSLFFRQELGEGYKNVRFNAIVRNGNKMHLIKYVTGSTSNYFLSNLTKATVDFEIANHSPYNEFISNRVTFINDLAPGFDSQKIFRYIETLQEHTDLPPVTWSGREQLQQYL